MVDTRWDFPSGNQKVGPNDAGIAHFGRDDGLFRECLQNSLDAAEPNQSVRVEVEISFVPVNAIAGHSLANALKSSAESKWMSDNHISEVFHKAAQQLQKCDTAPVMTIKDSGTTGTSGDRIRGQPSPWEALTESVGFSPKDAGSMGSYGLGKHAPFAASPMRTVLYSSCWDTGGGYEHRFVGKAILVTHLGGTSEQGHIGTFHPKQIPFPQILKLDEPGTLVGVVGYRRQDSRGGGDY